jgi:hypothetical protein
MMRGKFERQFKVRDEWNLNVWRKFPGGRHNAPLTPPVRRKSSGLQKHRAFRTAHQGATADFTLPEPMRGEVDEMA